MVCVVEEPADLIAIERSGGFRGLYHVLGGTLSPIDGVGPDALRIGELEKRVRVLEAKLGIKKTTRKSTKKAAPKKKKTATKK